jgi:hypothetical protein
MAEMPYFRTKNSFEKLDIGRICVIIESEDEVKPVFQI